MTYQRITLPQCLETSLGLRMPVFDDEVGPGGRVAALEDYLLLTAYQQGELAEERVQWLINKEELRNEWDLVPESEWGHLRRTRTETAVTAAKAQVRPELYDRLQRTDWMIKRLSEEMDRMEREATKASRAYTLITGS